RWQRADRTDTVACCGPSRGHRGSGVGLKPTGAPDGRVGQGRWDNDAMPKVDCQHDASDVRHVCRHLLPIKGSEYVHRFTGQGRAFDLLCTECASVPDGAPPLYTACPECFAAARKEGSWVGFRGEPEVLERPTDLRFTHQTVRLGSLHGDALLDV